MNWGWDLRCSSEEDLPARSDGTPVVTELHFPIDRLHCIGAQETSIPGKAERFEQTPAFRFKAESLGNQSGADGGGVGTMPTKTGTRPEPLTQGAALDT